MKLIFNALIFILFIPFFFSDVVSCSNTSINIQIYQYQNNQFQLAIDKKIARYGGINEEIYTQKEGCTFIGWIALPYGKYNITSIKDLENQTNYKLFKTIPHPNLNSYSFYPLLIENKSLQTFYNNSSLMKIKIRLFQYFQNEYQYDEIIITSRYHQMLQDAINPYLDKEGFSLKYLSTNHNEFQTTLKNKEFQLITFDNTNQNYFNEFSQEIQVFAFYE